MAEQRGIGALFVAACEARRNAEFLIDATHRLNGADALALTTRMAGGLARRGVKAGDRVTLIARPSVTHMAAWVAIARLGAIATSLHLLETDARLGETLEWLGATLVLTDSEFLERATGFAPQGCAVVDLIELPAEPAAEAPLDSAELDDPLAIALSSGSTGRPKGILHSHRTALASAVAGPRVYAGLNDRDSMLVAIGTSFGGWLNVILPCVAASTRIVFQARFEPASFTSALIEERITIAPLVPVMWRAVLAAAGDCLQGADVRLAFMSGEGPGPNDVAAIRARVTDKVCAAYLSTEGGCAAAILSEEGGPARPIEGMEYRVVPPGGPIDAIVPVGEIGELALRAPSVAVGYWRDPERQAARFVDGWWLSGDLGRQTADGIIVVGRTDHVINSGGVKIHAEEVEQALMRHPQVRQAAVIGAADRIWGQRVEAYVVADADADAEEIIAWCRRDAALPTIKLPKRLVLVDRLPSGPTGKLYRPALAAGGAA